MTSIRMSNLTMSQCLATHIGWSEIGGRTQHSFPCISINTIRQYIPNAYFTQRNVASMSNSGRLVRV
jgi:hypothetical protein